MLLASACRTRRQAQTIANTVILVLSALGGSMVPRFFMPEALQDLGWLTPNTWALEAYSGIFWRGEDLLRSDNPDEPAAGQRADRLVARAAPVTPPGLRRLSYQQFFEPHPQRLEQRGFEHT